MTKKFAELTAFIPRIKDDKYGEWIRVNQGTVYNITFIHVFQLNDKLHRFLSQKYLFITVGA